MPTETLLALDAGTSSMRGGIYDPQGRLLFLHQVRYRVTSAPDGRVEQDPQVFLQALEEIAKEAGVFCSQAGCKIQGIGLASQRSSLIPVDREGKPLRPAIMWQDKRTQSLCDWANRQLDIHRICGMRATPVPTAPKILWLKREEPEVWAHVYKLLGVHEFLLHRMTGGYVTDLSVASRSCLLDLERKVWSEPLLELFGARRDHLCALVEPGAVCGRTQGNFHKLLGLSQPVPVVSAGGDQQCATLGLGVAHPGEFSVNCGTGAYVITPVEKPVWDPDRNLICNLSALPGTYILEASTLASGMVYDWFVRQACRSSDYGPLDQAAAQSPPGAGGVIALPDLMGRGMPDWDADARGMFCNIGFHTTQGDLARAVLEGLAGELWECVELMRKTGVSPRQAVCSGGLCKNDLFDQIQADMYGVPLSVPQDAEATLRGIWGNTAAALGWQPDAATACKGLLGEIRTFSPQPENQERYFNINLARRQIYRWIPQGFFRPFNQTQCQTKKEETT